MRIRMKWYIWEVCLVEIADTRRMWKGVLLPVTGLTTMRRRNVSTTTVRFVVQNAVLVPTLLYGSETWITTEQWKKDEWMKKEMQSLRRICEVSWAKWIRNEEVHRMAGTSEDVSVRMKTNVLIWFGHVERMSDERMAKNTYNGKVSGRRGRGTPRLTFENTGSKLEERHVKKHEDPSEGKEAYRDRFALRSLWLPR